MTDFSSMPPVEDSPRARKADFPILQRTVNGHPLVYLDNAATTQKPSCVIRAIATYYETCNANVHRGVHSLSEEATSAFEAARARASIYLGASLPGEIVFTRGTTEGINLLAQTIGKDRLRNGGRIVLTEMEHHSNLVPWQMLARECGAEIVYIPVDPLNGMLDMDAAREVFRSKAEVFSCTHISNTLGTINPVKELCALARDAGAVTIIDAAQSAGHRRINVRDLGCDFLVCSGHKMCAPMGIGLLFGKAELLQSMPPWQGGGEMISRVTYEASTWAQSPHKFEAGTPNVEGAVGLHAAMDYLESVSLDAIEQHDAALTARAFSNLKALPGVRVFGPDPALGFPHAGAVSFVLEGIHAHDVVTLADHDGIALRGGHHCNQPLMKKLGVPATTRASFYFYNTEEDVECLVRSLRGIQKRFGKCV